jgi:hypothetical protein
MRVRRSHPGSSFRDTPDILADDRPDNNLQYA